MAGDEFPNIGLQPKVINYFLLLFWLKPIALVTTIPAVKRQGNKKCLLTIGTYMFK
jgi:hypothetical protein